MHCSMLVSGSSEQKSAHLGEYLWRSEQWTGAHDAVVGREQELPAAHVFDEPNRVTALAARP